MQLRTKEILIALIMLILALIFTGWAYSVGENFWQSVLLSLASTFLGLSIALVIVNGYLHHNAKRSTVKSLLKLVQSPIAKYHNDLTEKGHDAFGSTRFGELTVQYFESNANPAIFSPEDRSKIFQIVKQNKQLFDQQLALIDAQLRELTFVLGWSFSPAILKACFECRITITQFREIDIDDPSVDQKSICEHFLDADIHAFTVHRLLVKMLGLPSNEVYDEIRS